jgi:hypothetical protein
VQSVVNFPHRLADFAASLLGPAADFVPGLAHAFANFAAGVFHLPPDLLPGLTSFLPIDVAAPGET